MFVKITPHRVHKRLPESATPEGIFAAKYDWLLGWALHFTQNDRASAEDLVQETFVRFVLSQAQRGPVLDGENAEPLLYRYLKYAHLSQLRDVARAHLQSLDVIDYDSLSLSLRANRSSDSIEAQHSLRRVTTYMSWRKESAKSASILLLRFIHGYFPQEIIRIASVTRRAVDVGITRARNETKRFLEAPDRIRVMHSGSPPEVRRKDFAVSPEQLIIELQDSVFASCCSPCLPEARLLENYAQSDTEPISCELLAHVASCRRCLHLVTQHHGISPPANRSIDDFLGYDSRSRSRTENGKHEGHRGRSPVLLAKERLREARERLREAFVHRPTRIKVVVDGTIRATQDVTSDVSRLEVEIAASPEVEFLEVISEQGVCLLALPIPSHMQQFSQSIDLSDGRSMEASIQTRSFGWTIIVTYIDPLMETSYEGSLEEESAPFDRGERGSEAGVHSDDLPAHRFNTFLRCTTVILGNLRKLSLFSRILFLTAAGAAAALLVLLSPPRSDRDASHVATTLVHRAALADVYRPRPEQSGVLTQRIRIRSGSLAVERTVHKDRAGNRKLKVAQATTAESALRTRLDFAGVPWDEPLSAAHFAAWHDRQAGVHDAVKSMPGGTVIVTSTADAGEVVEESMTLRLPDLHEVARSVHFRNADTVDIAELSYEVLPWSSANADWFEPLTPAGTRRAEAGSKRPAALLLPAPLSDSQLDESELAARLVLTDANAYTSERLQIVRHRDGIEVRGIVATDERKRQLIGLLCTVPHVTAPIVSFSDMQKEGGKDGAVTSVVQVSDSTEPSPLTAMLVHSGMHPAEASEIGQELLNAAQQANVHTRTLMDLQRRFNDPGRLTSSARSSLSAIVSNQRQKLLKSVEEEEALLAKTHIPLGQLAIRPSTEAPHDLISAGDANLALCTRLTTGESHTDTSREPIMADFLASLRALQEAVAQVPSDAAAMEQESTNGAAGASKPMQ